MKACAVALAGLVMIAVPAVVPQHFVLIWNASQSVPMGLYLMVRGPLRVGDFVVVRLSETMQYLAEQRRYIGPHTPLLKRLAAIHGGFVCRDKSLIVVDRRHIVIALTSDRHGRPLPAWRGCYRLRKGQVFVLGTNLESFDSRYFGPLGGEQIIGRAIPLLAASPQ